MADELGRKQFRSIFISDLHLGAIGGKSGAVLQFLQDHSSDYLYLVGDIIDGWVGRKDRKWGAEHTAVIREVLDKANSGCIVRYTPGNHDSFMRRLNGTQLGNIEIAHSFHHLSADGKDFLVVHGDLFDRTCTKYRLIAFMGAWMHEAVSVVNAKVNHRKNRRGKKPTDFASTLKRGVKRWIGDATNYEANIAEFAAESGYEGVICGHVHRPMIDLDSSDTIYINVGDWVENCTAVVEHWNGQMELLTFDIGTGKSLMLPKLQAHNT